MTKEETLALPAVKEFLYNFSRHCEALHAVFEGQFLMAMEEMKKALEREAKERAVRGKEES